MNEFLDANQLAVTCVTNYEDAYGRNHKEMQTGRRRSPELCPTTRFARIADQCWLRNWKRSANGQINRKQNKQTRGHGRDNDGVARHLNLMRKLNGGSGGRWDTRSRANSRAVARAFVFAIFHAKSTNSIFGFWGHTQFGLPFGNCYINTMELTSIYSD